MLQNSSMKFILGFWFHRGGSGGLVRISVDPLHAAIAELAQDRD
jgi:hypothetical protein